MSPMLRSLALISLTVLALQPVVAEQFTVRARVDLVNSLFSVTDRSGRFVAELGPGDFRVEEDGVEQEIAYFATEDELPLTLALVIDTSDSVRTVFEEEKRTAISFLETTLRPEDIALVIAFDRSVTLFQDFTDNTNMLGRAIRSLDVGGGTSLYDAVYLAAKDRLRDEAGRKAIILISDGEDTTSSITRTEALIAAHQADAVIYSISNAAPVRRGLFGGQSSGDMDTLERFSEETGGAVYELDDDDRFEEIFARIADELRSQYSLGYYSTNPNQDGEYRELEIIPLDRDHDVRGRKGYYAPIGTSQELPVEIEENR